MHPGASWCRWLCKSQRDPEQGHWTAHVSCLDSRTHILTLLNFIQGIRGLCAWYLMDVGCWGFQVGLSWARLCRSNNWPTWPCELRQEQGRNETERVLQNISKHDPVHQHTSNIIKCVLRSKSHSCPHVRPAGPAVYICEHPRNTQFILL